MSAMRATNHGSMRVMSAICPTVQPWARASAAKKMRSAVGRRSRPSTSSSAALRPSSPMPTRPSSSERMALLSASSKVRPMAITSPTAFMRVERVSSDPWNFSKANRGTFTTQ